MAINVWFLTMDKCWINNFNKSEKTNKNLFLIPELYSRWECLKHHIPVFRSGEIRQKAL